MQGLVAVTALVGGGFSWAAAPAIVVVQPAPVVVADLAADAPAPPLQLPAAPLQVLEQAPASSTALAASGLPALTVPDAVGAAVAPPAPTLEVASPAAVLPRALQAGLPVLAMLIGAALVAVGWRRARR